MQPTNARAYRPALGVPMLSLGLALIGAAGCAGGGSPQPTERPVRADVSAALLSELCTHPCAGQDTTTLLRDAQGELKVVRFVSDPARCIHGPTTWFDASGQELLNLGGKPVPADVAEANQARIAELEAGLVEAGSLACPSEP